MPTTSEVSAVFKRAKADTKNSKTNDINPMRSWTRLTGKNPDNTTRGSVVFSLIEIELSRRHLLEAVSTQCERHCCSRNIRIQERPHCFRAPLMEAPPDFKRLPLTFRGKKRRMFPNKCKDIKKTLRLESTEIHAFGTSLNNNNHKLCLKDTIKHVCAVPEQREGQTCQTR